MFLFYSRIDHFTVSAGVVRSACQIYNDASLILYYPFDTTGTYNDYSVSQCNSLITSATAISSGRVNQAISFTSNTSSVMSQCFPEFLNSYEAFSFSLWVNPTSTTGGGSLVHISANADGSGTCYDHLVFTSTGALVFQWLTTSTSASNARGPIIPANTWTHVAIVYGRSNGMRLFVNGYFSGSSSNAGSLGLYNSGTPQYIILGNISPLGPAAAPSCPSGSISVASGRFPGSIDEFRLYNREIDAQEICVLSNP